MKEKTARYYPVIVLALLLVRTGIWFLPAPLRVDPYGAVQLTSLIVFDALFFLLGAGGFYLWRCGSLGYDLPAAIVTLPAAHLSALVVASPWHIVISGVWYGYITIFSVLHWRSQREAK